MNKLIYCLFAILLYGTQACSQNQVKKDTQYQAPTKVEVEKSLIDTNGQTIASRILPPDGYIRLAVDQNSFAKHLRQLPLKPQGAEVLMCKTQQTKL